MKKIERYVLTEETNSLQLPIGAEILTVKPSLRYPELHVLIDPEAGFEKDRTFISVQVGGILPEEPKHYIGNCVTAPCTVNHIFEV